MPIQKSVLKSIVVGNQTIDLLLITTEEGDKKTHTYGVRVMEGDSELYSYCQDKPYSDGGLNKFRDVVKKALEDRKINYKLSEDDLYTLQTSMPARTPMISRGVARGHEHYAKGIIR